MTTQTAVGKEMATKLQQFDTALERHGLTIDYLTERLKVIVDNPKSYNTSLSAIALLLKQQQILVERSEVTVTDGLTSAHDALKAKRASRDTEDGDLSDAIDKAIEGR